MFEQGDLMSSGGGAKAEVNREGCSEPIVIKVAHSSRYKMLAICGFSFFFACVFLVGAVFYQSSWWYVAFFFLGFLFTGYLLVTYWNVVHYPIMQFDGSQLLIRGVVKPIDLACVIEFDYRQDIQGTLKVKLACEAEEVVLNRQWGDLGIMVLSQGDSTTLSIIMLVGSFEVVGKRLKPPQIKVFVNDYLQQLRDRSK